MIQKPARFLDSIEAFIDAHSVDILSSVFVLTGLLVLTWILIRFSRRAANYIQSSSINEYQRNRLAFHVRMVFRLAAVFMICILILSMSKLWIPAAHKWALKHIVPNGSFIIKQLVVIGCFFGAWEFCYAFLHARLIRRSKIRSQRALTLFPIIINTLAIVFFLLYVFTLLSALGVNIMPLLTGAGVAGIAVGLGAQQSIRDVISGFTIIIEDLIQVGDVIKVGQHSGAVERITLRKIQLRDYNGTVYTVPYSEIKIIENMTKDFSFHVFAVNVAYDTDIDKAFDALRAVVKSLRDDEEFKDFILDNIEIAGVDSFGDNAITIRGRIKTKPIKQWMIGREFNKRLKTQFEKDGIEIPFPQRVIYNRNEDDLKKPSRDK